MCAKIHAATFGRNILKAWRLRNLSQKKCEIHKDLLREFSFSGGPREKSKHHTKIRIDNARRGNNLGRYGPTRKNACAGLFFVGIKKTFSRMGFYSQQFPVFVDIDSPSKILKVEGEVAHALTCDDGQLVCD